MALSTACAGLESSEPVCPSMVEYTRAERDRAAAEIAQMPADWITPQMLEDYSRLRDQVRACRG